MRPIVRFNEVPGFVRNEHAYVNIIIRCMSETQTDLAHQSLDYVLIRDFLRVTLGKPISEEGKITIFDKKIVVKRQNVEYNLLLS